MFTIVMVLAVINKKNLHIDEVASYILANNTQGTTLSFEEGITYTPAKKICLMMDLFCQSLVEMTIKL
jgi:hypothetical protein